MSPTKPGHPWQRGRSSAYNLIGIGGPGLGMPTGQGNRSGHDQPPSTRDWPRLGNYGGTTATVALQPGSPAIGHGETIAGITTDQRGQPVANPPAIGASPARPGGLDHRQRPIEGYGRHALQRYHHRQGCLGEPAGGRRPRSLRQRQSRGFAGHRHLDQRRLDRRRDPALPWQRQAGCRRRHGFGEQQRDHRQPRGANLLHASRRPTT